MTGEFFASEFSSNQSQKERNVLQPQWLRRLGLTLAGLLCCVLIGNTLTVSTLFAQDTQPTAASALDSIFNVRTAPDAKSMGIFQGSFLDAIRPETPSIQIAFLVDTTESMAQELPGIREKVPQVIADLKRASGTKVEVAIVSFADSGKTNKPLVGISNGFSDNDAAVQKMIDSLQPQSGRPYFPEAVDLAVFKTIQDLPWSEDEKATRWLMLITDAPPYDTSFDEPKTQSRRWYETDALVNVANQRGINIHGLLCESRPEEREAFTATVDKTRNFMGQLSSRTGGLMLDLSFSQIKEKVASAAKRPRADFTFVGAITDDDISQAKQEAEKQFGDLTSVRVAVMPHIPWNAMTFYHEDPGVRFASQLRYTLGRLPGVKTVSSRQIESEFLRLKSGPVDPSQWPQALCLRLQADILIVGDLRANRDLFDVQSQVYVANSAKPIAAISASGSEDVLMASYLKAIPETRPTTGPMVLLTKAVNSEQATDLREFWPGILGQMNSKEQGDLLSAMDLIEKSVDISVDSQQRAEHLESAIGLLKPMTESADANAFTYSLLASANYNLAKTREEQGQATQAKSDMQDAIGYLTKAFDGRRQLNDRLLQAEIEADHALLVRKDFPAAVRRYQSITQFSEASLLKMALRAHWMLAGVQCGDWGASDADDFQPNTQLARKHLIHILAFWPESEEARVIQKYMRWDSGDGKTGTPYFPKEGDLLLTAK
ncbi:vWA domain-containing protein [Bremerella alba]|nr:vWA domain-containing protein [Bremerella alba]